MLEKAILNGRSDPVAGDSPLVCETERPSTAEYLAFGCQALALFSGRVRRDGLPAGPKHPVAKDLAVEFGPAHNSGAVAVGARYLKQVAFRRGLNEDGGHWLRAIGCGAGQGQAKRRRPRGKEGNRGAYRNEAQRGFRGGRLGGRRRAFRRNAIPYLQSLSRWCERMRKRYSQRSPGPPGGEQGN